MINEENEGLGRQIRKPFPAGVLFGNDAGSVKSLRSYYKDRLAVPNKQKLLEELGGESDRSTIILMAAMLDDALTYRLSFSLAFEPSQKDFERIFRFEGPLGTFSARMEIAFLMGAIEADTYTQLNLIREMRNACAHSKQPLTFKEIALKNVTKRLFKAGGLLKPAAGEDDELKGAFVVESMFIYYSLYEGSREKGRQTMRAHILDNVENAPLPDTHPER